MDTDADRDVEKPPRARSRIPDLNGFGPRRRSTIRFALSVAVALAIVVALWVYQPGWFAAPAATAPPAQPLPTPTPVPKPHPPRYPYIGGTVRADGVWVTLLGVRYTHGSAANPALAGDVYAIVTIRIANHKGPGQDYTFSPDTNCLALCHFYVSDNQGEKNPPVNYDPYHTGVRPVVLQDGGYQVGSYTFEVPADDKKLQLLWYHDPLTDANTVMHWYLEERPRHGR